MAVQINMTSIGSSITDPLQIWYSADGGTNWSQMPSPYDSATHTQLLAGFYIPTAPANCLWKVSDITGACMQELIFDPNCYTGTTTTTTTTAVPTTTTTTAAAPTTTTTTTTLAQLEINLTGTTGNILLLAFSSGDTILSLTTSFSIPTKLKDTDTYAEILTVPHILVGNYLVWFFDPTLIVTGNTDTFTATIAGVDTLVTINWTRT